MVPLPRYLSLSVLLAVLAALFLVKKIHFELTTGARRRRMIKEYGCQPVYHWPHKGILGKLFGFDLIQESVKAGKEKRLVRATRQRFFLERKTVAFHLIKTNCTQLAPFRILT